MVRRLGVAKVADLQAGGARLPVRVEKRVLELQVAVADPHPVAVLEAGDELLEEVARLGLGEARLGEDAVEQLSAGSVLHDNGEVVVGEEHLMKLYDVRMTQGSMVEDLALHMFVKLLTSFQQFDCYHLSCLQIYRSFRNSEIPVSQVSHCLVASVRSYEFSCAVSRIVHYFDSRGFPKTQLFSVTAERHMNMVRKKVGRR
mmetsp:Transcript_31638/g.75175  ORF Transcript_31638/g.75175 Transcript_31638/m.75175 type:complete len:201 (+) Transcript_31638:850-1452(+)